MSAWGEDSKLTSTNQPPPRSIFNHPATPHDGRDPFFPDSLRPYEETHSATNAPARVLLTVKGYSILNGHPMLIINNHSFGLGDDGDVIAGGRRVHLRLLDIRNGNAVIDVAGARQELRVANQ